MTAVKSEMLPCPGCARDRTRVVGGPGTSGGPRYWAGCDHCNWRAWGDTEAKAIEAWNTRKLLREGRGVDPDEHFRANDPRPKHPGETEDDPYCCDIYCPSFFSCRRSCREPYQGGPGTISIWEMPDKLIGGLACSWFQPVNYNTMSKKG